MKDQKINCLYPDGTTKFITYKEVKDHNKDIIEDNVWFGLVHPGDYSRKEISDYYAEAMKEQKARMKAIRENPEITLVWNKSHEMYELKEEQEDD